MQFGISECLAHWARYTPDRVAVFRNGEPISYRQIQDDALRIAPLFVPAVTKNGRVALAVREKYLLLTSILGALKSGKSPVLLNQGLSPEGLKENIANTEVSVLVHDQANAFTRGLIDMGGEHVIELNSVPTIDPDRGLSAEATPGNEWGVLFSSGTTGTPKAIERSHHSIVTELLGWCLELTLSRGTVLYLGRPIYYTGGLVLTLSTLLAGGSVILDDYREDNDPGEVWDRYQRSCASRSVSWAFFVPDQLRAFVPLAKSQQPLHGADTVLVMGDKVSGDEKRSARDTLKSQVVESWGNTESLGTITQPEDLDIRPESIGRPFLGDDLRIVDENCRELSPHEQGRLAGSEEAGFSKYSDRPEATNITKRNQLIVSEDVGYVDDKGYFYVVGRAEDVTFREGKTVICSDIEQLLLANAEIKECCVSLVGADDTLQIIAAVVTRGASLKDDRSLLAELNGRLPSHQHLDDLLIVDNLQRTPSGKIHRESVRRLFLDA